MISNTKRALRTCEDDILEHAKAAKKIIDGADEEGRSRTDDENAEIAQHNKAIEVLKENQRGFEDQLAVEQNIEDQMKNVGPDEPVSTDLTVSQGPPRMLSMGEQFTESKAYKDFFGDGGRVPSGDWKMNGVELDTKATMLSGGTISGYGQFTQFVPGIVPTPEEQPTVPDLIPSNMASLPQIQFFQERLATSGAAGVAEAAGKPESVLDFNSDTASLQKIATYLPVSDEMLEDAPAIQAYINSRLSMFIRYEEERQVLRGTGTNEVEGFVDNFTLNGVGSATVTGTALANRGTAIYSDFLSIMNNQRGSSFLDPTALVVHPREFGTLLNRHDTAGQYYGGGPLSPGMYGGGRSANPNRLNAGVTLWNIPLVVTTRIGAGTMLLGNFNQGAALWRKGGISVSASNSHSDFFKKNLTAIRAEERLALTVYRPEAFTVIKWR